MEPRTYLLARVSRGGRGPEALPALLINRKPGHIEVHCTFRGGAFGLWLRRREEVGWVAINKIYRLEFLKQLTRDQYLERLERVTTMEVYEKNKPMNCSVCKRGLLSLPLIYTDRKHPTLAFCSRTCRGDIAAPAPVAPAADPAPKGKKAPPPASSASKASPAPKSAPAPKTPRAEGKLEEAPAMKILSRPEVTFSKVEEAKWFRKMNPGSRMKETFDAQPAKFKFVDYKGHPSDLRSLIKGNQIAWSEK